MAVGKELCGSFADWGKDDKELARYQRASDAGKPALRQRIRL
jgi:hypothetical protein